MERALAHFLRHQQAANSTAKTVRYYVDSIERSFFGYLKAQGHSMALADLTVDDARGWVEDQRTRGLSQMTLRTRVVAVRVWTAWLVEEDWLETDPLAKLKRPKVDDTAKPILTPQEVETLLRACDRRSATGLRDRAMLLTLYSTLVRITELRGIQVADVDHATGQILIRRGKGGKFRIVPLSPTVERALDRYLNHPTRKAQGLAGAVFLMQNGQPLSEWAAERVFIRLEARTGLRCNAHKWRHSGAVQYLRNGGKLEVLQKLLGHTTLAMTLHYARQVGADLVAGHAVADPARALTKGA